MRLLPIGLNLVRTELVRARPLVAAEPWPRVRWAMGRRAAQVGPPRLLSLARGTAPRQAVWTVIKRAKLDAGIWKSAPKPKTAQHAAPRA